MARKIVNLEDMNAKHDLNDLVPAILVTTVCFSIVTTIVLELRHFAQEVAFYHFDNLLVMKMSVQTLHYFGDLTSTGSMLREILNHHHCTWPYTRHRTKRYQDMLSVPRICWRGGSFTWICVT